MSGGDHVLTLNELSLIKVYNYSLDTSVYGGRFGSSSTLFLGAGESLQTMVFPQPVDKQKEKIN